MIQMIIDGFVLNNDDLYFPTFGEKTPRQNISALKPDI